MAKFKDNLEVQLKNHLPAIAVKARRATMVERRYMAALYRAGIIQAAEGAKGGGCYLQGALWVVRNVGAQSAGPVSR